MRLYISLILITVSMAFSAGYLSLALYRNAPSDTVTLPNIAALKRDFVHDHPAVGELSPEALFPGGRGPERIDPQLLLPQSARYPLSALRSLRRYAGSCASAELPRKMPASLAKAFAWHAYLCGKTPALPERFFDAEPFMHPAGGSFAYRAVVSGRAPFSAPDWRARHLGAFHAGELGRLRDSGTPLDPLRAELARLEPAALHGLAAREELVLGPGFVLLAKTDAPEAQPRAYRVYSRAEWDRELGRAGLRTAYFIPGRSCFYTDGQVCWSYNLVPFYRAVSRTTFFWLAASLALTALLAFVLLRKIQAQKLEEEKKRFALQTLTHELRTPLASLTVSLECLRNRFDELPAEAQDTFMRMCDDLQRLQRLTDASRQYLNSHPGTALIAFQAATVPSLNELLERVLEPYRERISFTPLAADRAFRLDAYWVGICLKNLVENALAHGRPPVRVTAAVRADSLELSVEDGGRCGFRELGEMTSPFAKGPASAGFGLGLAIVEKVAAGMRGTLVFQPDPTRFTLSIRETAP